MGVHQAGSEEILRIQYEIFCNSDINYDNKIDILDILMIIEMILSS